MRTFTFRMFLATATGAWLLLGGSAADAQPAQATGCETCHRSESSATLSAPARDFALADVHRDRGAVVLVDHHVAANVAKAAEGNHA